MEMVMNRLNNDALDWMPIDSGLALVPFSGDIFSNSVGAVAATLYGKVGSPTAKMALYLTEAGNTAAISISDINQGQIGDCFLLSAIGELVRTEPTAISNMIVQNTNGTETVTLHIAANGALPFFGTTAFKTVSVVVANNFQSSSVNNGAAQDLVGGVKEIWPQVVEQAVAQLSGGYANISHGGYPVVAMEELTGHAATYMSPASITLASLQAMVAAKDMIVLDTAASNATYNLVGGHAYMFDSLVVQNGTTYIKADNPWGFNQPSLIPFSALGKAFAEIDIGHPT
jgi:hypothetical protein